MKEPHITVGQNILQLIAEIDEFKGQWQALKTLSPERMQQLHKDQQLKVLVHLQG